MKYQIIGKNIEVTDSIRADIEKKLARMDKYFVIDDNVLCRAVVRSYTVGAKVEITIFTSGFSAGTNTYYYSTYNNPAIRAVAMGDYDLHGSQLIEIAE